MEKKSSNGAARQGLDVKKNRGQVIWEYKGQEENDRGAGDCILQVCCFCICQFISGYCGDSCG